MSFRLPKRVDQPNWPGLRQELGNHTPVNERSHDHDDLLEFLDKGRAENHFVFNPVLGDKRIRELWLI